MGGVLTALGALIAEAAYRGLRLVVVLVRARRRTRDGVRLHAPLLMARLVMSWLPPFSTTAKAWTSAGFSVVKSTNSASSFV